MNKAEKREQRRRRSTRQLMGIDRLTGHGAVTPESELVFFLLQPDNLSVLPAEGVRSRIRAMTNLLRGQRLTVFPGMKNGKDHSLCSSSSGRKRISFGMTCQAESPSPETSL